jgi:hypothetical protein
VLAIESNAWTQNCSPTAFHAFHEICLSFLRKFSRSFYDSNSGPHAEIASRNAYQYACGEGTVDAHVPAVSPHDSKPRDEVVHLVANPFLFFVTLSSSDF